MTGMGSTIFAEMSALAVATGSVNLGQGFPDTDGPREIAEAAAAAILDGRGNQYPPGPGVPELRRSVAEHQRRFYGLGFDPDTEVLVTAGATEAVAASLLALVEPGDEVIAFEPYYDSYAAGVPARPGRAAGRHHAADPADPAELAAQPDRVGLHPRRARRDRRPGVRARPARGGRRGLRAHGVRRGARADRLAARHAGAHGVDQLGRQDVLVHRLEDRLGNGIGRADRCRSGRQAVPHVRERGPVPVRDRRGAADARRVLRRDQRGPARQA